MGTGMSQPQESTSNSSSASQPGTNNGSGANNQYNRPHLNLHITTSAVPKPAASNVTGATVRPTPCTLPKPGASNVTGATVRTTPFALPKPGAPATGAKVQNTPTPFGIKRPGASIGTGSNNDNTMSDISLECVICWNLLSEPSGVDLTPAHQGPANKRARWDIGLPAPVANSDLSCTPCGHLFHKQCVENWIFNNNKTNAKNGRLTQNMIGDCPKCRAAIKPRQLYPVYMGLDVPVKKEPAEAQPEEDNSEEFEALKARYEELKKDHEALIKKHQALLDEHQKCKIKPASSLNPPVSSSQCVRTSVISNCSSTTGHCGSEKKDEVEVITIYDSDDDVEIIIIAD